MDAADLDRRLRDMWASLSEDWEWRAGRYWTASQVTSLERACRMGPLPAWSLVRGIPLAESEPTTPASPASATDPTDPED